MIIPYESPLEATDRLRTEVERVYAETRVSICSYLVYLGVPTAQAQEVTQEVFLRLYETMRKGMVIENLRAWLFRVAHNLGLKVRRRERAFRVATVDWNTFVTPSKSAEDSLIEKQRDGWVSSAMKDLSPQQRHCLYLRAEGLRYREIAEVTGISISTVNEFLRRAIARLAEAAK